MSTAAERRGIRALNSELYRVVGLLVNEGFSTPIIVEEHEHLPKVHARKGERDRYKGKAERQDTY